MRGHVGLQDSMLSHVSAESPVPATHPLRSIKNCADAAFPSSSGELDRIYASTSRTSTAPDRVIEARCCV
jgi:hypothetical protein